MPGNDHTIAFGWNGQEWLADGQPAAQHVLKLDRGSGLHKIKFRLDSHSGRFAFDEADPIWIKADDGQCPSSPSTHPDITVKQVGQQMVMVENINAQAGRLRYQLNVFDTVDQVSRPVDPIMENGGHT